MFRLYGTVKMTVNVAGAGVESYSQTNATAMTAAANPVMSTLPDQARSSFQVGQSRLGMWFNEKGAARAHIEIDFVDFSKATPTVATLPRLRIATVDWVPSSMFTLSVGQDWDLCSPVNPHGANLVGASFLAGNIGFMRQQATALIKPAGWEFGAAVGFPGVNATAKEGAFELGVLPSVAVRATKLIDGMGKAGVSGILAPLTFSGGTPAERKSFAGAGNVFADLTFAGATNVRLEAYLGQNSANIGLLSLAYGTTAQDMQEWGGYISIRQKLTDMHFVYGRGGLARVFNRGAVVPSYRYPTIPTDGTLPATSTAVLAGTGSGIKANATAVLGYELRPLKQLGFHLEGFLFRTEHVLTSLDVDRGLSGFRVAAGAEVSAILAL